MIRIYGYIFLAISVAAICIALVGLNPMRMWDRWAWLCSLTAFGVACIFYWRIIRDTQPGRAAAAKTLTFLRAVLVLLIVQVFAAFYGNITLGRITFFQQSTYLALGAFFIALVVQAIYIAIRKSTNEKYTPSGDTSVPSGPGPT